MAHFTRDRLEHILHGTSTETPRVAIETGTWKGDTTKLLASYFKSVTTIELSPTLHYRATQRFMNSQSICCLLGDSAEILPQITENKVTFFYLDAHGGKMAAMVEYGDPVGFPLWQELEYISQRLEPDIVVVDDVASFGFHSKEPKWSDVTCGRCIDTLDRVYRMQIVGDQLAMYRTDIR